MPKPSVLSCIKRLGRPVFTTGEMAALSGKSSSAVTQALNNLAAQGVVNRVYRGIWVEAGRAGPYSIIPFLSLRHRVYVSFVSALHLHGIIEQIPQVITLASTAHSRTVQTKLGTFSIHQIMPTFYKGFDWYRGGESFLIAEPEKALVDSLYLSARKKKQFGFFPELRFPKTFRFSRARKWTKDIAMPNIRGNVTKKLEQISNVYDI